MFDNIICLSCYHMYLNEDLKMNCKLCVDPKPLILTRLRCDEKGEMGEHRENARIEKMK